MFNFVTKSFIKDVNKFLSDEKFRLPIPVSGFSDVQTVVGLLVDGDFSDNQISRLIVSYALNLLSNTSGSAKKFDDGYNSFRNFDSELLYVYKHNAAIEWLFHIGCFVGQNDENETRWFKDYVATAGVNVGAFVDEAISLRNDGNVLLKCSTTIVNNEEYMFANYTLSKGDYCSPYEWRQNRIAFDKKRVNDLFDKTYAHSKYIPLRGFVRYDSHGKGESIKWLDKLSLIGSMYTPISKAIEFASVVLSYFVKGACMAVEGEYRHVVINEAKLNSITLNEKASESAVGTFNESLLKKLINKQYQGNCIDDFACGVSIQEWNQYYDNSR